MKNIEWQSGPWSASRSEALLSTDGFVIYSLFAYGNSNLNLYLVSFDKTTGGLFGARYKSAISNSSVYFRGSKIVGDFIVATFSCSNEYLFVFNLITAQFIVKEYASGTVYQVEKEPIIGR